LARRPLAVRRYPAARELAAFGFHWFDPDRPEPLDQFLHSPDHDLLDTNHRIAASEFGLDRLPAELAAVLERVL
jgi:hypothetical protein